MNILTFDIEEWALAKVGGFGTYEKYSEYDSFLNRILDVLDECSIQATFFCTGLMATDFPQVVKLIQSHGHEIGCHSYRHTWMNKMTEAEAREDTHAAVDALEQCIGEKIRSYRAPAFSISESNKWMFEILAENGIECDASIFPAVRDFGGFASFDCQSPCLVKYNGLVIREFPIGLIHLMGKQIAYSGGGYFRFFPLRLVKHWMEESGYNMCYFHINDLLRELKDVPSKERFEEYYKMPGTLKNRYIRYVKANLGKKSAWRKLEHLIRTDSFINIREGTSIINWATAKLIEL